MKEVRSEVKFEFSTHSGYLTAVSQRTKLLKKKFHFSQTHMLTQAMPTK